MAALAGVGASAATGGLIGALVAMGIPEYEAKRYEGRVKDGGVLLSVSIPIISPGSARPRMYSNMPEPKTSLRPAEKAGRHAGVDAPRVERVRTSTTSSAAAHSDLSDLEDTADLTGKTR